MTIQISLAESSVRRLLLAIENDAYAHCFNSDDEVNSLRELSEKIRDQLPENDWGKPFDLTGETARDCPDVRVHDASDKTQWIQR